jgi:hypothetical protein
VFGLVECQSFLPSIFAAVVDGCKKEVIHVRC